MNQFISPVYPDGLQEFSVVFTDRSLNHMSAQFQKVMLDINETLCSVYNASSTALVPGGGTFAMEAVARQFGEDKSVMVLRNGWFSFRWTQILDASKIAGLETVLKARQTGNDTKSPFAPLPIAEVVAAINETKPDVFFAPHVETSSGIILPNDYMTEIAEAVHANGGLFVLDCIASGCIWVDMKAVGVDVLISAPQKGWSGSPCAGMVMMSEHAQTVMAKTQSSSFSSDLKKWADIMQAYVNGGHAYHATMPTDALKDLRDTMVESAKIGFDALRDGQQELGDRVRANLKARGIQSVAADGFGAPGVVVSFAPNTDVQTGAAFAARGMQIAAGVPLQCDEPTDYASFRLGLFGLDKITDVDGTIARLDAVLDQVL